MNKKFKYYYGKRLRSSNSEKNSSAHVVGPFDDYNSVLRSIRNCLPDWETMSEFMAESLDEAKQVVKNSFKVDSVFHSHASY